jgi:anti-anti-sigma factor
MISSFDTAGDYDRSTGGLAPYALGELLGLTVRPAAAGLCVVTVDGELDMLTTPLLRACVGEQLAADPEHLILDLEPVRFLGSSGLSCLIQARELAGPRLHLTGLVTRAVIRPLEITGLLEFFDSYLTLADALAVLSPGGPAPQTLPGESWPVSGVSPGGCVFTASWCRSVGTTWTVELRPVGQATLTRPVEWIYSGVPTEQPAPRGQTAMLLRSRDLLLFPDRLIERMPRTRSRQPIGYVTREPEVMRLARTLADTLNLDAGSEHPMVLAARWLQAGYSADDAARWITVGEISPPASAGGSVSGRG